MGPIVTIALNEEEVELILDSLESHRRVLADAAIEPASDRERVRIERAQRHIFTLSERLQ